jgi:peptidoglycan-associated lipoprotein
MKRFSKIVILGLILTVAVVGCRKRPGYLTPLPGQNATAIKDPGATSPFSAEDSGIKPSDVGSEGIAAANPDDFNNWPANAEIFKEDTVYFAFDSFAVQGSEKAKVAAVAEYLKSHTTPRTAVRVEGHCDERGTEEYNRSLGERRALAVREELVSLGIEPNRILTVSFGEDRPAVTGNDESAWRKNRRGEFILLTQP